MVCEKGHRAFMMTPGVPLSSHLHVFTTLELFRLRILGLFWRLHHTGMISPSQSLSLSQRMRDGVESSKLKLGLPGDQLPL